jgi:hypothetical protein
LSEDKAFEIEKDLKLRVLLKSGISFSWNLAHLYKESDQHLNSVLELPSRMSVELVGGRRHALC